MIEVFFRKFGENRFLIFVNLLQDELSWIASSKSWPGGNNSYLSLQPPFCFNCSMILRPEILKDTVTNRSSPLPKLLLFRPLRRAILQTKIVKESKREVLKYTKNVPVNFCPFDVGKPRGKYQVIRPVASLKFVQYFSEN